MSEVALILQRVKRCPKCGETKATTEFGRNKTGKDGLQSRCKPCHSAAVIASQKKHNDRFRVYQASYRRANPEKFKARQVRADALAKATRRDGRFTSMEKAALAPLRKKDQQAKQAIRYARWVAAHPDRAREASRRGAMRHYALKKNAAGAASVEDVRQRWAYYGGRCWMCDEPATQTDHVIALNRGGSEWPSNLRPACGPCNRSKSDQDHRQFLARAS